MPLYEFRCDDCGVFDAWRAIAERSTPASCPSCEEPSRRIFSAPALQLSGALRVKGENLEPQLVKREVDPAARTKARTHSGGRPWMIGH
ncbi:FmdB family zinc ribbon protein [Altericista sp. CCNU0014]|uniref:FmdB family zinc ribbon protein n=1 Tax=Altericista sp. CCNU0014 TaxID=3082949 RepID=UPI00384BB954